MNIRLAKLDDLKKIIDIERLCFPPLEAASEESIHRRFQTFPENFIVAEENGEVIGFINGCTSSFPTLTDELYDNCLLHNVQGDYQMVFGLDVLEEYRCQGVGYALMIYFIDLMKSRDKKAIVLTCKDHLIHYYEKFGFVHLGLSQSQHGNTKWNDMILKLK